MKEITTTEIQKFYDDIYKDLDKQITPLDETLEILEKEIEKENKEIEKNKIFIQDPIKNIERQKKKVEAERKLSTLLEVKKNTLKEKGAIIANEADNIYGSLLVGTRKLEKELVKEIQGKEQVLIDEFREKLGALRVELTSKVNKIDEIRRKEKANFSKLFPEDQFNGKGRINYIMLDTVIFRDFIPYWFDINKLGL